MKLSVCLIAFSCLFLVNQHVIAQRVTIEPAGFWSVSILPPNDFLIGRNKICVEVWNPEDSAYIESFLQLFDSTTYKHVQSRKDSDLVFVIDANRTKGTSFRQTRSARISNWEKQRGVPPADVCTYTGFEELSFQIRLETPEALLIEAFKLKSTISVIGRSRFSLDAAETDYNEKAPSEIDRELKRLIKFSFDDLCASYLTCSKTIPAYSIEIKSRKEKNQAINQASDSFVEWLNNSDQKLDSLKEIETALQAYLDVFVPEYKKKRNTDKVYSHVYYLKAWVEFVSKNYDESFLSMKEAVALNPEMISQQKQLWYALNLMKERKVFN